MRCIFSSPLEKKTEEHLTGIFLETVTGQRGILSQHQPIVAQLKDNSFIRLQKEIGELKFRVGPNSFFKFSQEEAIVLTSGFSEEKEY